MKFMIEKVLEVAKTNQVPTPQTDTLSLESESQFLNGEVRALWPPSSFSLCSVCWLTTPTTTTTTTTG
jgi:hypothetical protein